MERFQMNNLSAIRRARNSGAYEIALKGCEELLSYDRNDTDALRMRAGVLSLLKRYEEAFDDYQTITQLGPKKAADYYLGSNIAFELGEYEIGCVWLQQVLAIGEIKGDDAFDSAAYFLLAYGKMQQVAYGDALDWLTRAEAVDSSVSLPLPGESGVVTSQHLRARITSLQAKR
jgi:tetratricopeptide (TPR) repeat protein